MKHLLYRLLGIITLVISLTHCSAPSAIQGQFTVNAARYLNPDVNGQTSPVVLTVYELKAPFAFKDADFSQLNGNAASVLGTNLIDKQSFEIKPGSSRSIKQVLSSQTKYVGITAAYRNIDTSDWRQVVAVKPGASTASIVINLASQSLIAKTF